MPQTLPDRYFAGSSYFEAQPVRIPGTGFFTRTGDGWVDDGTTIQSSTPGDTVTYATKVQWSSFGDWRSDNDSNVVEISLNGGPFQQMLFYPNGTPMYSAVYDTITIRIPEGGNVRIEELWLI